MANQKGSSGSTTSEDIIVKHQKWMEDANVMILPPDAIHLINAQIKSPGTSFNVLAMIKQFFGNDPEFKGNDATTKLDVHRIEAPTKLDVNPREHLLWRTNHRLSLHDKPTLESAASTLWHSRIHPIDSEILEIQMSINDLMVQFERLRSRARDLGEERSGVVKQIEELKSFSSSSRLLPADILAYIFEIAITCQRSRNAALTFARQLSLLPLVLGQSCLVPRGGTRWVNYFYLLGDSRCLRSVAPFFCRITDLRLNIPTLDLFNFLAFPGASELPLQRFSLAVSELRSVNRLGRDSDQRTPSISCPHLTKLYITIRGDGLSLDFSYLDLPALAKFVLVGTRNYPLRFADFRPLLERSWLSIRSLELRHVQISRLSLSEQIFDTLGKLPSLEHLTLEKMPYAPLGLINSVTQAIHPLPNIQKFSLSVEPHHSGNPKEVVDDMEVLISAWMAESARRNALEEISFSIFCPFSLGAAFKEVPLAMHRLKKRVLDLYGATNEIRVFEVRMKAFIYTDDDSSEVYSCTYHGEHEEGVEDDPDIGD